MKYSLYKNYIFDLYGTLVDISTDEISGEFWKKMARRFRARGASWSAYPLKKAYLRHVSEELNLHEEFQAEQVFRKLFEDKKICPEPELVADFCHAFRSDSTRYVRLYPGAEALLKALKSTGKKVYLLSNAQRSFTYGELTALGIEKYFDGIYISSDYKIKKPNTAFFRILLEKENLNPADCLMIGNDEICDISGGRSAGLATFYLHTNLSPDYTGSCPADYCQMEMAGDWTELQIP